MLYAEFDSLNDPRDKDVSLKCNSLSKTEKSFNCKLTIPQAIRLATTILQKTQILIDEEIPDGAVKLWNIGSGNRSLLCGLDPASKPENGARRKRAISS